MEIQTLKVDQRTPAGSRAAARLRRAGKLPAIIYGHKLEPVGLTLDRHAVEMQLAHGAHLINLEMEGRKQPCLIKDVQYDHLGSTPIHVDLTRVELDERVKVRVPIEVRGHAKGVAEGGVLFLDVAEVEVECKVAEIPDKIRVDVGDLELDQVLHVKDLELPAGMVAITDSESVVAMVKMPAVKAAEVAEATDGTPAAAEGEPEVIAKGKAEEDEAGKSAE